MFTLVGTARPYQGCDLTTMGIRKYYIINTCINIKTSYKVFEKDVEITENIAKNVQKQVMVIAQSRNKV